MHSPPKNQWYNATVIKGQQLGRTIGYPTLNLSPVHLLAGKEKGVYACHLMIDGKQYHGALYYGPRLVVDEKKDVLEIFVFDFDEEIYGDKILFQPTTFIRGVLDFTTMEALKQQLHQDCAKIQSIHPHHE